MIEQQYSVRNLLKISSPEGHIPLGVRPGQTLEVLARNPNNQEMIVPIIVLFVYPNGDYIGEVTWFMA